MPDEPAVPAEARGLVDWSPYTGRTPCPRCGQSGRLEVRQVLRAKPLGTWSLAGAQLKFPASVGWEFRCGACGGTGPASPKETTDEDAGRDALSADSRQGEEQDQG